MPRPAFQTAAALLTLSLLPSCTGKSRETQPSPTEDSAAAPGTGATPATELGTKPAASAAETARIRREGNHLLGQPSPYLEQHAHNPVDWYPWGEQALSKAKREHKPIFLSIGYSTCHWCHVMEEESFEDDEVAAFLNEHFVSIKVDREQRPDVDALYISAVGAMGSSTGWPLTVFLTPQLEPYLGGTYFPRHAKQGRPGFMDILEQARSTYAEQGEEAAADGRRTLAQVERRALASVQRPGQLDAAALDKAMLALTRNRDPVHGGFGNRQKFPNTPLLHAELRHIKRRSDEATKTHLLGTLDQMLRGGVRDHAGGSFHRYAVDTRWHIPHFEKTLYDNAQLASLYVEAGITFERPEFVAAGRAILDDLVANWRGVGGGFIVGFDADDPGGEGAFYSWTPAELERALGPDDAKTIGRAYGVTAKGDHKMEGRSVLHRRPNTEVAEALGLSADDVEAAVQRSLPKLAETRSSRPKPRRDDKVLVAWNGLAIMALADVGRWLDEPRYTDAAAEAAAFILDTCWTDGRLVRGYRAQSSLGVGFLEDYAIAALGLLRLHAATGDLRWLDGAVALAATISSEFYDPKQVALMRNAREDTELPVRLADMDDGVMPSGGSAAIRLALELGAITGDEALYAMGYDVLTRSVGTASTQPFRSGFLLQAIAHAVGPVREVVIAGDPDDPTTAALWATLRRDNHAHVLPVQIPGLGLPTDKQAAYPALAGKRALKGKATAFVCERGSCQKPTSSPKELRAQLDAALPKTP